MMKKLIYGIVLVLTSSFCFGQHDKYREIVDGYHKESNFNGSVLIATNGKIDYLTGIGLADRKSGTPLSAQSKFKIASMTKVFTAILTMKLCEAGKIQLDQTIGRYFPSYKGIAKDKVTIHQLLTYSSGIENQAEPLGMGSYQVKLSLDEYIDRYCSGKLVGIPGEKSNYGNTEYIILQKIIENVADKNYEKLLREMILNPLKMRNTGVLSSRKTVSALAGSYTYDTTKQSFAEDAPYFIENFFAAGNMYSTVEDLLILNNALFGNKILSEHATKTMLAINENLGYTAYGLWGSTGWGNFNETFYYRTGGILGATANWINTLKSNKTIIVMSNTDATNLYEISEKLYLADPEKK